MNAASSTMNIPNLKTVHKHAAAAAVVFNLTDREMQVLQYICRGLTMKEIAGELFLAESTIISHKRNLLVKFNARNLVRLAVLAERHNLLAED